MRTIAGASLAVTLLVSSVSASPPAIVGSTVVDQHVVLIGLDGDVSAFEIPTHEGMTVARSTVVVHTKSESIVYDRSGKLQARLPRMEFISGSSQFGVFSSEDGPDGSVVWDLDKSQEVFRTPHHLFPEPLDAFTFIDRKTRLRGFMDVSGEVVLEARFRRLGRLSEGLAIAYSDSPDETGRYRKGYVTASGDFVISPQFILSGEYTEDRIWFEDENGKSGYLDGTGRQVIRPVFDYAFEFSSSLACVSIDGKWGFIDKQGQLAIPLEYDDAGSFVDGLTTVIVAGKTGVINTDGKYLIEPTEGLEVRLHTGGYCAVYYPDGKLGVMSVSGDWVVQPTNPAELLKAARTEDKSRAATDTRENRGRAVDAKVILQVPAGHACRYRVRLSSSKSGSAKLPQAPIIRLDDPQASIDPAFFRRQGRIRLDLLRWELQSEKRGVLQKLAVWADTGPAHDQTQTESAVLWLIEATDSEIVLAFGTRSQVADLLSAGASSDTQTPSTQPAQP